MKLQTDINLLYKLYFVKKKTVLNFSGNAWLFLGGTLKIFELKTKKYLIKVNINGYTNFYLYIQKNFAKQVVLRYNFFCCDVKILNEMTCT